MRGTMNTVGRTPETQLIALCSQDLSLLQDAKDTGLSKKHFRNPINLAIFSRMCLRHKEGLRSLDIEAIRCWTPPDAETEEHREKLLRIVEMWRRDIDDQRRSLVRQAAEAMIGGLRPGTATRGHWFEQLLEACQRRKPTAVAGRNVSQTAPHIAISEFSKASGFRACN